jgi:hypothetical protein
MSEFKSNLQNLPVALFQWAQAQKHGTLTASLRGISELKSVGAIDDVDSTNLLKGLPRMEIKQAHHWPLRGALTLR